MDFVNVILDLWMSDLGYNFIEDLSNEENLNVGDSSESRFESVISSDNFVVKEEKVENIDRISVELEEFQENKYILVENVECSNDVIKN